jgi:hypothetical protein
MRKSAVAASLVVWPIFGVLCGVGTVMLGPEIEVAVAPIIADQAVDGIAREDDVVCWTWHWTKLRGAIPVNFAWSFRVAGTTVAVPAVVTRRRDGKTMVVPSARDLGAQEVDLCAVIPDDLVALSTLTIRGEVRYLPDHHLWTLTQPIVPVQVPSEPPAYLPRP